MPDFEYEAKTAAGEKLIDIITMPSRREVIAYLKNLGYFPLVVREKGKKAARLFKFSFRLGKRISQQQILFFTEQMSHLLNAGIPVSQALSILAGQVTDVRFQEVLGSISDEMTRGNSFSHALSQQKGVFSSLYVNMVYAGETSGALSVIFKNLSTLLYLHQETAGQMRSSLAYPLIMLITGGASFVFLMSVVVPRIVLVFRQMGQTLPFPTRILIGLSNVVSRYWWVGLIAAGVIVSLYQRAKVSKRMAFLVDGAKLRLPLFGEIIKKSCLSRFASTLATLLSNGVGMLDALKIAGETISNDVISQEVAGLREKVTDGKALSQPLRESRNFPSLFVDILAAGEETGDLPRALNNIAQIYSDEAKKRIKLLTSLFEPLIIIFMAFVVGFIVISVLLPIFDITSGLK